MQQPNFLQVTNSLKYAMAFCEANPDLTSSKQYTERLAQAAEYFERSTRETDHAYTRWRQLLGEELTAFKVARREYDRTCALADEHGYDDFPHRRFIYTERDALLSLLGDMVKWLDAKGDEWDWLAPRAELHRQHISDAAKRLKVQKAMYESYTVTIKARISAYEHGVSTVREYISDARREAEGREGFDRAVLDFV